MKTGINVDIQDGIATITLNKPKVLNAMTSEDFDEFSDTLREIDAREDVAVTIWQATGRVFSAGLDLGEAVGGRDGNVRQAFLERVVKACINTTQALHTHRKLLVAALSGPVMGIAAAYLGHFDFIYALPTASLAVPFTTLGMVTEAGSSVTFVRRMGIAHANEVLLLNKQLSAQDLLSSHFINEIFPAQSVEAFNKTIRAHVQAKIKDLDSAAILSIKVLVKSGLQEQNNMDAVIMREGYAQAGLVATGVPRKRIANKVKHGAKPKL